MTRPLHHRTKVQRAEGAEAAAPEERQRGYEPSDASPRRVVLVSAALLGLMVTGLVVAGILLRYLRAHSPDPAAPFAEVRPVPPAPRLLTGQAPPLDSFQADPVATPAPEEAMKAAMRQVEAAGWGEDRPAPSATQAAREHADAGP